jgi:cholesterol transport system auxiliary component
VKRLSVLASALALVACGSLFKSQTPPPSSYMLSANGVPTGALVPVDLTVLKPRVRVGLDNDLIAVMYPDRRLDHLAGAQWGGPLDEVVQDLTVQVFRSRLQLRNVQGDASAFGSGYWLEIDVVNFQAEYGATAGASGSSAPTAHVQLFGRLGTSADRRVLGRFEADARQPAAENRMGAIVEAYNQAANTALARIADDAVETLRKDVENR